MRTGVAEGVEVGLMIESVWTGGIMDKNGTYTGKPVPVARVELAGQ